MGLATAFAIATLGSPSFAAAQSEQGMEHGRGHKDKHQDDRDNQNKAYANNKFFQQGLSHGQSDRANNRASKYHSNPRNGNDRQAYRAGYDQGYSNYNNQYGQYGNG